MTAGRPARGVVALVTLLAVVLIVSGAGTSVQATDRTTLYGVFAASVVVAGALGWSLARLHRRLASLRWTILSVAVVAVVTASGVVAASTSAMFLAPAELRLVLAALLLGAGLGVLIAVAVAGPLTADLRVLADAAGRVTDGDLDVRTGITRRDEVGDLATSVDRMVAQLARSEERRAQGEAARRRLLAAVGHDLRTPLASLQAAVESLEDGIAPDPARYLRSMHGDVARLRGLVDDLFVLTRLEAGELRLDRLEVDLGELVDGAVEAVTALATAQAIEVQAHVDGAARVAADPAAVDRVLRNLLDNAIRHAPRGTTVAVSVTATDGTGTIRVHDDGAGFPEGFADRAFDRFSRADPARDRQGGSGLGLAIARELVEAHGGRIWIDPPPGATVVVELPSTATADGV